MFNIYWRQGTKWWNVGSTKSSERICCKCSRLAYEQQLWCSVGWVSRLCQRTPETGENTNMLRDQRVHAYLNILVEKWIKHNHAEGVTYEKVHFASHQEKAIMHLRQPGKAV